MLSINNNSRKYFQDYFEDNRHANHESDLARMSKYFDPLTDQEPDTTIVDQGRYKKKGRPRKQ